MQDGCRIAAVSGEIEQAVQKEQEFDVVQFDKLTLWRWVQHIRSNVGTIYQTAGCHNTTKVHSLKSHTYQPE